MISENYRALSIAKLILILEQENNILTSNKLMTYYLIVNPLLGLWSLHARLIKC
jgi:hypothetical protein